jgi:outer membrane protein TolC
VLGLPEDVMVGLKVSMKLFNGFRTREQIRQAKCELRIKRLEMIAKERALVQAQRERQTALDSARDQLGLALARRRLEKAR